MLSVAGGVFYTLFNQAFFYLVFPLPMEHGSYQDYVWALSLNFSVLIWSFIAWCPVVFALSYDEEAREQNLRLVEAQALAAESQNQMLRYQSTLPVQHPQRFVVPDPPKGLRPRSPWRSSPRRAEVSWR